MDIVGSLYVPMMSLYRALLTRSTLLRVVFGSFPNKGAHFEGVCSMTNVVAYVVGQAYSIAVGLIHWFPSLNAAREVQPYLAPGKVSKTNGVRSGVFESLLNKGWATELPAQGMLLPCCGLTADDAIKQRQAMVELAEQQGNHNLAGLLRAIWVDAAGQWIEPLFAANSAFTRGLSLPNVLLAKEQAARANGEVYDPALYQVQVVVKQFASELDRLTEQAFENESRRMIGTTDMSWPDLLKAGHAMLAAAGPDASASLLRKAFRDGNGMKAYDILIADGRFESLNLIERIKMPRPENFAKTPEWYVPGGYVPAASIPQNAKELRTAVDADAAEEWIRTKVFGGSNAPKVMAKTAWESARAQYRVQDGSPLGDIISAHLHNTGLGAVLQKWPQLAKANCVLALAIEPVAVEPVAVEPVAKAIEPVAVEPVAKASKKQKAKA